MSSINANVWGPKAWYKFHMEAMNYSNHPTKYDIQKIIYFYQKIFPEYITCQSCRQDYFRMIRICPIRPYTKNNLFNWTVDIHNIVNVKLGKLEMSYSQAFQIWNRLYQSNIPHRNYSFPRHNYSFPRHNWSYR